MVLLKKKFESCKLGKIHFFKKHVQFVIIVSRGTTWGRKAGSRI